MKHIFYKTLYVTILLFNSTVSFSQITTLKELIVISSMPFDRVKDSLTTKFWVLKTGDDNKASFFQCKEATSDFYYQFLTIEADEHYIEFTTKDSKLFDILQSQVKENNLTLVEKNKKDRSETYQGASFKVIFSYQCRGKMVAYVITITR